MKGKAILLAMVIALSAFAGGVAASDNVTFTGDIEGDVEEVDGTVEITEQTEELVVTENVTDVDEGDTYEVNVSTSFVKPGAVVNDSDVVEDDYVISSDGNVTVELELVEGEEGDVEVTFEVHDHETGDAFDDAITVNDEEYDAEVVAGGSFAGGTALPFDTPESLENVLGEDLALFLFYAITVGLIIMIGLALYMVYEREALSTNEQVTAYGGIALGSIGVVLTEYAWAIVVAFVVLLLVVLFLRKKGGETVSINEGTQYIE